MMIGTGRVNIIRMRLGPRDRLRAGSMDHRRAGVDRRAHRHGQGRTGRRTHGGAGPRWLASADWRAADDDN